MLLRIKNPLYPLAAASSPLTKPLALSKEYPGKKTEGRLFNKRAKSSLAVLELVRITNFCLLFDDCLIDINPYMPTPALHQTPQ